MSFQVNTPTRRVAPVTPKKKQLPTSPLVTIKASDYSTPNQNIPKTPQQKSILRNWDSVSKRRKVAFASDDYVLNSSSEESDLMELDVS